MHRLTVFKIGGNVIDSEAALVRFLDDIAAMPDQTLLVHGGGKLATDLSAQLGLTTTMIDGRRVTDATTLRLVTMVYAGFINKTIVAGLQARGCNALGFMGADGDLIRARKRPPMRGVDYGFVGDVESVNTDALCALLASGFTPVCAPLTHDGAGTILNTNADTVASALACALAGAFDVELVYCFEKAGVLRDVADDASVIPELDEPTYQHLRATGIIAKGMIPKLDNAFAARRAGVRSVVICRADDVRRLRQQSRGVEAGSVGTDSVGTDSVGTRLV
jgi:acetylglutamate kinase